MSKELVSAQYKPQQKNEETGEMEPTGEQIEISANFEFGEDLDEMISLFDRERVYHHAKNSMRVGAQAMLRAVAAKTTDAAELQKAADEWEPTSGKPRGKTKLEKAEAQLEGLSEEAIQKLLEKYIK